MPSSGGKRTTVQISLSPDEVEIFHFKSDKNPPGYLFNYLPPGRAPSDTLLLLYSL